MVMFSSLIFVPTFRERYNDVTTSLRDASAAAASQTSDWWSSLSESMRNIGDTISEHAQVDTLFTL